VVDINQRDRTIRIKIVYYGPALGGKTTNLRVLYERALSARRGEFVSVNSMQDRTILCDLLPLHTGGFRGYDLRIQLLAVPGQAMYAATRRVVLKGADGVVFVANSASDRWHENSQSQREMQANLIAHQLDPTTIPLVVQYNKRDLPQVAEIPALERELNPRGAPGLPSVAKRGEGVLETLSTILSLTVTDLSRRYRTMELPPHHSIEAWTKEAVAGMFGRQRLDRVSDTPPVEGPVEIELADGTVVPVGPGDQLRVRVTTPEDAPPPAPGSAHDPRPPDAIAVAYAQASTELSIVVNDLREERDAARARLGQMRSALELAAEPPSAAELESTQRGILHILVGAGGASHAALRLGTGELAQVFALAPLVSDPLSRTSWGGAHLDGLRDLAEPMLEDAVDAAGLTDALRASEPSFEAVTVVPLRSGERLFGLALLYYGANAVFPSPDALLHLGFLARVLAGPLQNVVAREAPSAADRLRVLSRASAAAVASLLTRPAGEPGRRQRLDLADVLGPLRLPGVALDLTAGTAPVLGDAPLLRFALATLVHVCEAASLERGQVPEIAIRAAIVDGQLCVSVSGGGSVAPVSRAGEDDADAELSVVQAVLALQGAVLHDHGLGGSPRFTVQLTTA
jgi:signal recognition particle receptor subunit beta